MDIDSTTNLMLWFLWVVILMPTSICNVQKGQESNSEQNQGEILLIAPNFPKIDYSIIQDTFSY